MRSTSRRTRRCSSSCFLSAPMAPTCSRVGQERSRIMGKPLSVVAAVIAALATTAGSAQAALKVITTTEDLASIAREVGGDKITVESLAKGYQDPHFVE